jgi:predicted RNA binding protein YcfA (HicA-like mRNA interferase family)
VPKLPGVPHLQAVRALEKAGFRVVREGKHTVMSDGQRILTFPEPIRSTLTRWAASFATLDFPSSSSRLSCRGATRRSNKGMHLTRSALAAEPRPSQVIPSVLRTES